MPEVMLGRRGDGVAVHESMRPPFQGRSFCGLLLGTLWTGPQSSVTCGRCRRAYEIRSVSTEQDEDEDG